MSRQVVSSLLEAIELQGCSVFVARRGWATHQAPIPPFLPSSLHHHRCFVSKKGGSQEADKAPIDRGARYGVKLQSKNPALFERMRLILGYYDSPAGGAPAGAQPPKITSVTINMLQTLKYLDLPQALKDRLMTYKVQSLNRQLEGMHAHTLKYLNSLTGTQQQQAGAQAAAPRPAGLAALLKKNKSN